MRERWLDCGDDLRDIHFLPDLDDALALTTECMKGDVSRVGMLTLAPDAGIFIERYGKQSTLVTVGDIELQTTKLSVLNIADSFKDVRIVASSKDKIDVFREIVGDSDPSGFWVIGDRPDVEIRAGFMLRIPTIRMRIVGGKYYGVEPRNSTEVATHTFSSFKQLLDFLEKKT